MKFGKGKKWDERLSLVFGCFLVVAMPFSALAASQEERRGISTNSAFNLSESQRAEFRRKYYRNQDGDAAYEVSVYYGFAVFNHDLQRAWLTKAARLGKPVAQYNLAFILYDERDPVDRAKARYWLSRANRAALKAKDRELLESIRYLRADLDEHRLKRH